MDDSPGRWKFHPHTADAKFEAYGKSREELFENAGLACVAIITDAQQVQEKKAHKIALSTTSLERLLFDYLDELFYLLDTEGLIMARADITITQTKKGYSLEGTIRGDHHKNYDVSSNLKAVTYNEMNITQEEKGWTCTVVVDI